MVFAAGDASVLGDHLQATAPTPISRPGLSNGPRNHRLTTIRKLPPSRPWLADLPYCRYFEHSTLTIHWSRTGYAENELHLINIDLKTRGDRST